VAFSSKSSLGVVIQQMNYFNDYVNAGSYYSIFAHNIFHNGIDWIRRNPYSGAWATIMNNAYYAINYAPAGTDNVFNEAVSTTSYLSVLPSGNVGISTSAPSALLHIGATEGVAGTPYASSTLLKIYQPYNSSIQSASIDIGLCQPHARITGIGTYGFNSSGQLALSTMQGGNVTEVMRLNQYGNVLIGRTDQVNYGYKLDVNGIARINKIIVNTSGADYVFDSTYQLKPLQVVEKYITANHHLPDVASAAQMKAEGLDVGENQTVLLKKVEELTLYVIQLQHQLEEIKAKLHGRKTHLDF
jgi:hypothetical protein